MEEEEAAIKNHKDFDMFLCKTLVMKLIDKGDPKLQFLKNLVDTLKEECCKKFDASFQNDKFNAEYEIFERYESEFKNVISLFISKHIYKAILENICPGHEETDVRSTFTGTPDFLCTYYINQILEYIEQELLTAFLKKFHLPKEDEWTEYLQDQMPKYKKSGKKPEQRVFPFNINEEPYIELLEFSLKIF